MGRTLSHILIWILCVISLEASTPPRGTTRACARITLDNGKVKIKSRGRVAKFKCRKGYTMFEGDRFATCVRGQWNGKIPKCITSGCEYYDTIPHGEAIYLYDDALVQFHCLLGYSLEGSPALACDGDDWNGTVPVCQVPSNTVTSCDFEDANLCGWMNGEVDHFDWTRNQGPTASFGAGTGPRIDHTLGSELGHYMYIEASVPREEGNKATLFSPVYQASISDNNACFGFYYHMYGNTTGHLNVYVKEEDQNIDFTPPIFQMSEYNQDKWILHVIPLEKKDKNFQIVLEGVRGPGYMSDIAIDDVQLTHGDDCERLNQEENSQYDSVITSPSHKTPPTEEVSTDSRDGGGKVTGNPGGGSQATGSPDGGSQVTGSPDSGSQVTESPVGGSQMTGSPGNGSQVTVSPDSGSHATGSPGNESQTTKNQTTASPGGASQAAENPDGRSHTAANQTTPTSNFVGPVSKSPTAVSEITKNQMTESQTPESQPTLSHTVIPDSSVSDGDSVISILTNPQLEEEDVTEAPEGTESNPNTEPSSITISSAPQPSNITTVSEEETTEPSQDSHEDDNEDHEHDPEDDHHKQEDLSSCRNRCGEIAMHNSCGCDIVCNTSTCCPDLQQFCPEYVPSPATPKMETPKATTLPVQNGTSKQPVTIKPKPDSVQSNVTTVRPVITTTSKPVIVTSLAKTPGPTAAPSKPEKTDTTTVAPTTAKVTTQNPKQVATKMTPKGDKNITPISSSITSATPAKTKVTSPASKSSPLPKKINPSAASPSTESSEAVPVSQNTIFIAIGTLLALMLVAAIVVAYIRKRRRDKLPEDSDIRFLARDEVMMEGNVFNLTGTFREVRNTAI